MRLTVRINDGVGFITNKGIMRLHYRGDTRHEQYNLFILQNKIIEKLADYEDRYMHKFQEVTSDELKEIIKTREPIGIFYTYENEIYTCVDNRTGEAWTEDFKILKELVDWLIGRNR